jgi:hypothetical protein
MLTLGLSPLWSMKILLVVAMANAAIALGLTVTMFGITGALGADTAVWAITGRLVANNTASNVFFILFFERLSIRPSFSLGIIPYNYFQTIS